MAVMKPNNPFDMLASVSSAPSVAVSPYDYSANTNITMTTQHQQNIDYFMSYASPNLLTIQETISNDVLADIGEDSMKKRIKQDVARKLAEEIVSTKVTFTSQENYAEHTRIIRAKTYVFTADELKLFIEKCIK
jgi:hypothetical protein